MNAIMTNFNLESRKTSRTKNWEGLSEIDQAIRDNRLMEYRVKKSWADPWGRKLSIAVLLLFLIFVGFVVYWDLIKG